MNKNFGYLIFCIAIVLSVFNLIQKINYSPDDTFIYLQYAKNLAGGNGFSFNPGEPSYGITSPLWSLLLTTPFLFHLDPFWFAKILDFIFAVASVIVFFKLCGIVFESYDEKKSFQLVATSIFIVNSWFVRWSFTGMETSLAVLVMLSVFFFYFNERRTITFVLCGLLFLIRPESFLLGIVLTVDTILRRKISKDFFLGIILGSIIAGIFLLYAKQAFGTIFPNTTLGKATFSLGFEVWYAQIKKIVQTIAFSNAVEGLACMSVIHFLFKKNLDSKLKLFSVWVLGLIFLYVITDADIISRYLLLIIPLIIISAYFLIIKFDFAKKQLIIYSVAILSIGQSQFVQYKFVKPSTDDFIKGMNECFIPIGKWLNDNTPKNSRILLNDVGAVGFYANRYIIDVAALVNGNLELNKKIMSMPVEERKNASSVLKFIDADYVIQRDDDASTTLNTEKFQFILMKEFPSLGISNPKPQYYKLYKILK